MVRQRVPSFQSLKPWIARDSWATFARAKMKIPAWLQQKRTKRGAIAITTAVVAFFLGQLCAVDVPELWLNRTYNFRDSTPESGMQQWDGTLGSPQLAEQTNIFIAIMTTPIGKDGESVRRRSTIRETWLSHVPDASGVIAKFVVGRPTDSEKEQLQQEINKYKDQFIQIDVEECPTCGAGKLLAMLSHVSNTHNPKWFIKVEDSVYVSPSHALAASYQWEAMRAEYVGCLEHKRPVEWYDTKLKQDADRDIIAWHYHAHARRSAYAVSGAAVRLALLPNYDMLRPLQNEETSVALWMLAFKVNFWDDMRMCTPACSNSAIVVTNNACEEDQCDPISDMRYFEGSSSCHEQVDGPLPYQDSYEENKMFEAMRV